MQERQTDPPIGIVGRLLDGPHTGFFIEIDDDTERPGGSGGYYVLMWTGATGYDHWYVSFDDLQLEFARYGTIEWLSEEQSASIQGRHSHGA